MSQGMSCLSGFIRQPKHIVPKRTLKVTLWQHPDKLVDPGFEISFFQPRLKRMDDALQERLINWGYAVCDAALRKYVKQNLPKPVFPYPAGV